MRKLGLKKLRTCQRTGVGIRALTAGLYEASRALVALFLGALSCGAFPKGSAGKGGQMGKKS
jgi:hypothetical protein